LAGLRKVRQGGRYNMSSREAREAAGLRREEWLFCMQHYAALEAAEAFNCGFVKLDFTTDPRDCRAA
jgi:hypothetical protein